jgi:hypothetical protein
MQALRIAEAGTPAHPSVLMCIAFRKSSSKSRGAFFLPFAAWLPAACFSIIACIAFAEKRACKSGAVPLNVKVTRLKFGAEIAIPFVSSIFLAIVQLLLFFFGCLVPVHPFPV